MKSLLKHSSKIALLILVALLFTGCAQKIVINNVGEKEANAILVLLASKGVRADKIAIEASGASASAEQMFNIQVAETDSIDAMAIMNRGGFPREKGASLLSLFGSPGLVPSEREQTIRYQAGLQEQLAMVIRKIDGVLEADVMLSFPKEELIPGLDSERVQIVTASVYVKHQGILDDPNSHLESKIKRLVASSIQDLEFANVTVISDRSLISELTIPGSADRLAGLDGEFTEVWSMVLARESLSRFRIVFFSFLLVSLFFFAVSAWLLWKVMPLIRNGDGIRALFTLNPLKGVSSDGAESEEGTPIEEGGEAAEHPPTT